jgi:protein gp37
MRAYCSKLSDRAVEIAQRAVWLGIWDDPDIAASDTVVALDAGPLPNVWLGVSAERQQEAEERVPQLLHTPAAIRFVSAEPLLGPIDLRELGVPWVHHHPDNRIVTAEGQAAMASIIKSAVAKLGGTMLDWVIAGGESGAGARPMHPDWARSLRDQCAAAGVPFFFKQHGRRRCAPI